MVNLDLAPNPCCLSAPELEESKARAAPAYVLNRNSVSTCEYKQHLTFMGNWKTLYNMHVLCMRRLWLSEVKFLAQGHTAAKWQSQAQSQHPPLSLQSFPLRLYDAIHNPKSFVKGVTHVTRCWSLKFVDPMNEWGNPALALADREDAALSLHRGKELQSRKWRSEFQENTNIQSITMGNKQKQNQNPTCLLATCVHCYITICSLLRTLVQFPGYAEQVPEFLKRQEPGFIAGKGRRNLRGWW